MKVTVSVPGKVFLMGEHAVVYGKPALICAINQRLTVSVSASDKLSVPNCDDGKYLRYIIGIVLGHFQIENLPRIKIEITSDIPVGYHLGSSAAVAAALVGALSYYLKKNWNPQLFNQLAYDSEKMVCANSSGVDVAAVISGGMIWYRKEMEFLRSVWQLPFNIPDELNHFYLVDTGKPAENTGEMVNYVGIKYKAQNSKYKRLFDENEIQTKRLAAAIKEKIEIDLIDSIKIGERTLEGIGVVSSKVIPLIREIEKSGGAAKILGGGGKKAGVGYLLCYHQSKAKLTGSIKTYGCEIKPIQLGAEGIKLEQKY
jgi:mevalonate kinase